MSIRNKLIAIMSLLLIVPLVAVGFITNDLASARLVEKLNKSNNQALELINGSLDEYFDGIGQLLLATSNTDIAKKSQDVKYQDMLTDYLSSVKQTREDIGYAYMVFPDKQMIISPHIELPSGYDPTSRDWYKRALEKPSEVIFNKPYIDVASGELVVTLSKAVKWGNDIVGVLAIDCSLSKMSENLSKKEIGNTGFVYITDSTGTIIAHPNKEKVGQMILDSHPIWKKAKNEDKGFLEYTFEEHRQFGSFIKNHKIDWVVMITNDYAELSKDTEIIRNVSLIATLIAVVIGIAIAFLISNNISKNIKNTVSVLENTAKGNFDSELKTKNNDEFKTLTKSYNAMTEKVSEFIKNIQTQSETVNRTSEELLLMSSQMTDAISDVAISVDSIAKSTLEQTESTKESKQETSDLDGQLITVGQKFIEMNGLFDNTKALSNEGLSIIDDLTEKSKETEKSTFEVTTATNEMKQNLTKINEITETLANITSQTNLLSLNASIEAARAGDSGRGFSVVADEIRKLAEQSKSQTENIKTVVDTIQNSMQNVSDMVAINETHAKEQIVVVDNTKEIFHQILESIQNMNSKLGEISEVATQSNKTKEMLLRITKDIVDNANSNSSSVENVMANIEEINATMEEFTSNSRHLKELASDLESTLKKFRTKDIK